MSASRTATFATLALLLAGPALAHPGGVKDPAQASAPGACSTAQLAEIDAAWAEAGTAVAAAVARLNADPNLPELRRWFGTTPAKFVRMNLERIAAHIARGRPADTACEHPVACREQPFAYANPGTGAIGFCRPFFQAGARGQDSRFGIVVHEVSHLAVRTRDATYQPQRVLGLAKTEPAVAAMNADSYEYFVEELFR